jgi:hypothetical protein
MATSAVKRVIRRLKAAAVYLGMTAVASAASWSPVVTPLRVVSENLGGQLVIQISTVEPIYNPAACPIADGYMISDPLVTSASLATALAALSAGRQIAVFVTDSCNGRPMVSGIEVQ